jgi:hypothetical protein
MIISKAVELAKADLDRHSSEIQKWAHDFLTLLSPEWQMRDLVFIEAKGMDISYIALCDWDDPSRMLVVQTIPSTASDDQLKMVYALTSVTASLLLQRGHFSVGVALLGENGGKMFWHEGFVGRCRFITGCSRIPEAESQFNFNCIPGHICRTASPVTLN